MKHKRYWVIGLACLSVLLIAADMKISQLGNKTAVDGGEYIPFYQGTTNGRLSSTAMSTFVLTDPTVIGTLRVTNMEVQTLTVTNMDDVITTQLAPDAGTTNFIFNFSQRTTLYRATNNVNFLHATNKPPAGFGRSAIFLMECSGTARLLTLNANWQLLGSSNALPLYVTNTGVLSLYCYGTSETNVIAAFADVGNSYVASVIANNFYSTNVYVINTNYANNTYISNILTAHYAYVSNLFVTNLVVDNLFRTNRTVTIATNADSATLDFLSAKDWYEVPVYMETNLVLSPTNLMAGREVWVFFSAANGNYDVTITNTAEDAIRWNLNSATNGSTSFTVTNGQRAELAILCRSNNILHAVYGHYR